MKKVSTLFLRATIIGMVLAIALIGYGLCFAIYQGWNSEFPAFTYLRLPAMMGVSATAIAFWVASWQAWKLLGYIDKDKAFSTNSVTALRNISYCAAVMSLVYILALPVFYHIADHADAPGLMVIGLTFACAPIVVAVFSGLVQRLLQNVIDMKSENDLTV